MTKLKCPFRKHQLPKRRLEPYTPPPDKVEGTDIRERGYFPGSSFTPAELEFIKAIDEFRKKSGRKFLSAVDHLRVVASLGWLRLPAGLKRPHTGKAK